MSKTEQYIKKHTKLYSNISADRTMTPWLTPDQARKAVEIAREETIKEVCEWIKNNAYSYTWCEFQQHERGVETGKLIEDLKKYLESKL